MSFFHVQQDYKITHTNHFFVEAPTLEAAVEEIRNGQHQPHATTDNSPDGDYDHFNYDGSVELNRNMFSHTPIVARGHVYRSLNIIATEIASDWKNVYFGAVPYLRAMESLDKITNNYGADTGKSIVAYFLANAQTWRGETARRIKGELNAMLDNG